MNDIVYIPKRLVFLASTVVVLLIGAVVSLYAVQQPSQTETQIHAQTVSQNGQPVCKDQTPHDIVLVFDVSSSMTLQADPNTGASRLDEARAAAKNFVQYFQGVNSNISNANQRFQIGLVRFSDYINGTRPIPQVTQDADNQGGYYQGQYLGPLDTRVMNGLTQNFNPLYSEINSMKPPTSSTGDYAFTCTQCGIREANSILTTGNAKNDGRKKTVIILTDGHANWRQNTSEYTMTDGDTVGETTVDNAAYNELNGNITYYTIGVGDVNANFLQTIANRTGGTYQPTQNGSNLTKLYQNIADTIVTPATGKISGYIYNDINHNNKYDNPPDQPLANFKVTITGGGQQYIAQSDANGYYEIDGLCAGTYTLVEKPLQGWIPTPTGTATVTITDGGTGKANFGNYLSSAAWIQDEAFDIRIDQGFTDSFAPTINSQWGGPYAYASLANPSYSQTPGVILGGSDASFVNGQASKDPYNWSVGTLRFPEVYSNSKPLNLSYATAYSKAFETGKQAPPDLQCKPDACSLFGLPSGYYHYQSTSQPLTFNGLLVAGKSYTLLVDSDVKINGAITVQPGSFFMIVSSGSITVDQSLGVDPGTADTVQNQSLQGIFVADNDFVIQDNGKTCNNGGISDNALYAAGNIVVNATRKGGRFVQERKLCGTDAYNPVFRITPRLDMLMNFPSFLMTPTRTWQEVAP